MAVFLFARSRSVHTPNVNYKQDKVQNPKTINERSFMQISKKAALGMLSLGLVAGTAGAVGLSVHAQQVSSAQQPTQQAAVVQPQQDAKSATDTDNIQDPTGQSEQPDAVTGQKEQPDTETADSKTEAQDNGTNSGHQDQGSIDHRFEGQE